MQARTITLAVKQAPQTFMCSFHNSGEHVPQLAVNSLPKKLRKKSLLRPIVPDGLTLRRGTCCLTFPCFQVGLQKSKDILMKLWDQDKPRQVESVSVLSDFNVVSLASRLFLFDGRRMGDELLRSFAQILGEKRINLDNDKVGCMDFFGQSIGRAAKLLPDGRWEERL